MFITTSSGLSDLTLEYNKTKQDKTETRLSRPSLVYHKKIT